MPLTYFKIFRFHNNQIGQWSTNNFIISDHYYINTPCSKPEITLNSRNATSVKAALSLMCVMWNRSNSNINQLFDSIPFCFYKNSLSQGFWKTICMFKLKNKCILHPAFVSFSSVKCEAQYVCQKKKKKNLFNFLLSEQFFSETFG